MTPNLRLMTGLAILSTYDDTRGDVSIGGETIFAGPEDDNALEIIPENAKRLLIEWGWDYDVNVGRWGWTD